MNDKEMNQIISKMSKEERAVVDAIRVSNKLDEKDLIDSVIKDVNERRARFFDIIYIDLSIDRSTTPLELSGAGTLIAGIEATDNVANCTIKTETPAENPSNSNDRITFIRGKRLFAPYSKFYVYHAAQAGKYIKLLRGFGTRSIFMGFEDDSGESANSDLVTALGNSSAFTTAQVAVDTTAGGVLISASNTSRKRITIKVPATAGVHVFIRGATGVTTANGHRLDPGDAITLNTTDEIYGIVSAGSVTVTTLEE